MEKQPGVLYTKNYDRNAKRGSWFSNSVESAPHVLCDESIVRMKNGGVVGEK